MIRENNKDNFNRTRSQVVDPQFLKLQTEKQTVRKLNSLVVEENIAELRELDDKTSNIGSQISKATGSRSQISKATPSPPPAKRKRDIAKEIIKEKLKPKAKVESEEKPKAKAQNAVTFYLN